MRTAVAVQQDQNRADYLEYLYGLYDRGNPAVDNCLTYTGLYQQHVERVGIERVLAEVERFHEDEQTIRAGNAELPQSA